MLKFIIIIILTFSNIVFSETLTNNIGDSQYKFIKMEVSPNEIGYYKTFYLKFKFTNKKEFENFEKYRSELSDSIRKCNAHLFPEGSSSSTSSSSLSGQKSWECNFSMMVHSDSSGIYKIGPLKFGNYITNSGIIKVLPRGIKSNYEKQLEKRNKEYENRLDTKISFFFYNLFSTLRQHFWYYFVSIILAFITWKATKKIKSDFKKIIIRYSVFILFIPVKVLNVLYYPFFVKFYYCILSEKDKLSVKDYSIFISSWIIFICIGFIINFLKNKLLQKDKKDDIKLQTKKKINILLFFVPYFLNSIIYFYTYYNLRNNTNKTVNIFFWFVLPVLTFILFRFILIKRYFYKSNKFINLFFLLGIYILNHFYHFSYWILFKLNFTHIFLSIFTSFFKIFPGVHTIWDDNFMSNLFFFLDNYIVIDLCLILFLVLLKIIIKRKSSSA